MTKLTEATPEVSGFYPDRIERIRERAAEWVESEYTQGLVLLVARKGKIALHEAWGDQSFDDTTPIDRATTLGVSSVSKVVTATAIMMLVEDGALSLNRQVREYLPEMSGKYSERMLMHQLLTHTSGLADVNVPPLFVNPPETEVPCPDDQHLHIHRLLQSVYKMDCHKKPGEQNMYCNENFLLLGEVIRRVTGQDIEAFSQAHIFKPLGMTRSSFGPLAGCEQPVSRRDPATFPFPHIREMFETAVMSMGSLKTCAMDLAVFGQTFLNGGVYGETRLLNDWTVAEMTRNQIPGIGSFDPMNHWIPDGSWGLGWMVQGDARWPWSHGMLQPRGTYFHQGASGSSLWVDPVHDVVGVFLSISNRSLVDENPHWEFDTFQNMVTAAIDHSD